ncbi:MAG: transcriptional coactivator p15/PC4 family protein [Candidatus Thiodiazotropha sp.]
MDLPAYDSAENCSRTGSDQDSDQQQQQLCQIDIGNNCYVVGKTFKGQMLIHIRKYDRRDDGTLFPTKKGTALNLEKWKNFCTVS